MKKVLVWDMPVRLGHWLMAGGFVLAWVTSQSEALRLVHVLAGGTVTAAALFRLVWGVVGSRHARFASFVRGPRQTLDYLKRLPRLAQPHHTGHNPAGGWLIVLMLLFVLLTCACGWLAYQEIGGEWLVSAHKLGTNLMLAAIGVHVLLVMSTSSEHLGNAMFSGRKQGLTEEAIAKPHWLAAIVLLIWTAVGTWWLAL